MAAACLWLAGKVEETPKKCRDVLKVAQSILTEQQMANFGSNPREELLTHERIVLQTIKFDLQVQHPYTFLLEYGQAIKGGHVSLHSFLYLVIVAVYSFIILIFFCLNPFICHCCLFLTMCDCYYIYNDPHTPILLKCHFISYQIHPVFLILQARMKFGCWTIFTFKN